MPDTAKHLLIVEDEGSLRAVVAERLADEGYEVVQAAHGEEALEPLAEFAFDIVITDLRLPGIDGGKVLEAAVARYPEIIGIVVTGYGTVKDAVEAIKRGASDFITKPFQFDELLHVLDSALEQRRLKSENAYLRSELEREAVPLEQRPAYIAALRNEMHSFTWVSGDAHTLRIEQVGIDGSSLAARGSGCES